MSAWGEDAADEHAGGVASQLSQYGSVVGVVLFNYALTVSLPSWLNEKQDHVSVPRTIWGSVVR